MDYQNFNGPDGQSDNPGGTAGFILYAPKRYFATGGITKPMGISTASTWAEMALNSTDFVFEPNKGWHRLYLTFDTGELEAARQGELDGYSFATKGKGFHPGIEDEILGFWRVSKNDRFVILVPTASTPDDGKYIQCGDDFFDAYLNASKIGTATNTKGRRGSEIELMTYASGMYKYNGVIDMYP